MKYLEVVTLLCATQFSFQQATIDTHYNTASVATDVPQCSQMGKQILLNGGSAVDAAITSVLCVGVVNPQSSGIGGGLTMVVYIDDTQTTEALMALERAPQAATPDMFPTRTSSKYGVKTVAIPCEINGLWKAHQRYGRLTWAQLFQPVISLAQNGYQITKHLAHVLGLESVAEDYPEIVDLYRNADGTLKQEGDIMTSPTLAATLQKIADDPNEIINASGSVVQDIVNDIHNANGILIANDFSSIEATWEPVESMTFKNGLTMKSTPLTASGPVLQFILNVLDQYTITSANFSTSDSKRLLYHRYLEATKFAFGLRYNLGDDASSVKVQDVLEALRSHQYALATRNAINDDSVTSTDRRFYGDIIEWSDDLCSSFSDYLSSSYSLWSDNEEEGYGDTSHISVLSANGDAVSVTTSVGYYFGSKFYSSSTGVFLNNHMANFYFPARESNPIYTEPTNANSILAGRRYTTSTCPSLIVDSVGKVKIVVGASGGSRIVSANAWVILRTLWMGADLKTAIDEKRIAHFLPTSNKAYAERVSSSNRFSWSMHQALEGMGHDVSSSSQFAVVQAILTDEDGGMDAYSNPRKGGEAAGY